MPIATEATLTSDASPGEASPGAVLRRARLNQQWDIKEAAARLKLGSHIVEALENDAFERLGAPIFVRSYLQRYADLLGLPRQQLLERFQALGINQPPPLKVTRPVRPHSTIGDLRWLGYPLLAVALVWVGWIAVERVTSQLDFGTSGNTGEGAGNLITLPGQGSAAPAAPAASTAAPPPAPVTPPAAPALSPVLADTAPPAPPGASEPASPTAGGYVEGLLAATDSQPAATAAAGSAESGINRHQLVLRFSEDCWVEVKDSSGERLAYGLNTANSTRTLVGSAPFTLMLGNSTVVTIELNGKTVDTGLYYNRRGPSRFVLEAPAAGATDQG
jgi:cytoskeleton protein RodZ